MGEHTLFEDIQESMKQTRQPAPAPEHSPLDGFTQVDPAALGVADYVSEVVQQIQKDEARKDAFLAGSTPAEEPSQELPPVTKKVGSLDGLEALPEPITMASDSEAPVSAAPPQREQGRPEPPDTVHTVYDLDLMRSKYNEAVNREYYLMQQAGRIQNTAALFLAVGGAVLSLCFNQSVPGYFLFYISACICPISLGVVLALAYRNAKVPRTTVDSLSAQGLSEEELIRIYADLQEGISFTNDQREKNSRRNAAALTFCVILGILFIIVGIGIGA